jgi:O-antigen/teichoic acid export membrane protein
MTGNEKALKKIFSITALINLVLSLILVEFYQEIGVAISTALSVISWNVWGMHVIKRKLGFWTISIK